MTSPALSPLSQTSSSDLTQVPAPRSFRPIQGEIRKVYVEQSSRYHRAKGDTPAKEAGLVYEEQVQTWLLRKYSSYLPNPCVEFYDNSGFRLCRPDGLLPLKSLCVIFEIKKQHVPEAWWQLERLYRPVIEKWHTCVQVVEIVKSFDPQMPFPCPVQILKELDNFVGHPAAIDKFGVLVWDKKHQ